MKKQIILLILIFITLSSSYGQDLDSLVQVIKTQKDTTQVNSLNTLGRKLRRINPDSSKATFQRAIESAKKIKFYKGQIRALQSRGITFGMNHEYADAISDFSDAVEFGEKYHEYGLTADAYNGLGIVYKRIGDYVTSLKYYNKSLIIYKKNRIIDGESSAYENMGVLYDLMGELENSYSYYLSAYKINDSLQNVDDNHALSLNITLYHIKKKQFKKAISILHENAFYFDSIKSYNNLLLTYNNFGYAYKLMKDQDSTIFYSTKSIDLFNTNESINQFDVIEAYLNRSEAYLKKGELSKALQDANINFELSKDLGFARQFESYKLKADLNEALGNYKASNLANKMAIALKDSLFEENKVKQYKAEQIKQQVFNKNQQIANQESNIQALNEDVERKQDWNLFLIILISLFLIVSVFVYNKITLKRKISIQEAKRLKELDDLKSRFITNITHEFRTPLTIILGYLDNLKEQFNGKEETTTSLNTIEKNSNNLLSLVNQMLDLAKLEQGRLSLNFIQNDVVEFIEFIINSFSSIAGDKNIKLSFKSEMQKLQMDFDAEKLRQVFSNLISNAIKFSEENTEITIKIEFEDSNKKLLKISVSDQGFGIPEKDLPQVFDRFFQVENQDFKVSQGTGIGLALTKELLELMSGSITVNSVMNQGTVFTIILPIEQNAIVQDIKLQNKNSSIGKITVPELEPVTHIKDSNTVLIVEDNRDLLATLGDFLVLHGYMVDFADNVTSALCPSVSPSCENSAFLISEIINFLRFDLSSVLVEIV